MKNKLTVHKSPYHNKEIKTLEPSITNNKLNIIGK